MKDLSSLLQADLSGLGWFEWCDRLNSLAGEDGYCDPLGPDHAALLIEKKPVLLVTFETRDRLLSQSTLGQPMAWPAIEALGWSHLALFSNRDTWFRDPYVYAHFDRLIDDGFFDEFEQVVFYGAGSCGYAACAFSVAVPGARVLALQPQATLDVRHARWDTRFPMARRLDFTSRFGHAPDMLDAADHAWILYDPDSPFDAVHASLFERANTTVSPLRCMGADLQQTCLRLNVLFRMMAQISAGKLTRPGLGQLMRARRRDEAYLTGLMLRLEQAGQFRRMKTVCEFALARLDARPIRRGLKRANRALQDASPDIS